MTTAVSLQRLVDVSRSFAFWVCVALMSFWMVDAGIVIKSNGHATCVSGSQQQTTTTTTTTR